MGKLLYVHIGPHKTGTTSLQHFLFSEREGLLSEGILFPCEDLGPWMTQHRLAFALRGVPDRKAGDTPEAEDELRSILRQTQTSNAETIVLSAESLSFLRPEAIRKLRDAFSDCDTRVVLYARPQDQLLVSAFSQRVKSPLKPFAAPIDSLIDEKTALNYSDIYTKAAAWAEVFGRSNILVRVYTEIKDAREDFLYLVGGEALMRRFDGSLPSNTNTSPSLEALEYMRAFKRTEKDPKIRARAMMALTQHFSENGRKPIQLLSSEDRWRILERCRRSNERLFREFLDRENAFAPEILLANIAKAERVQIDTSEAVAFTRKLLQKDQTSVAALRRFFRFPTISRKTQHRSANNLFGFR